jgi:hypothetical protein
MAQKKHAINVEKMRFEIQKKLDKQISKKDLSEILNVSRATLDVWDKKAPDIISSLTEYTKITGLPIETIIKEVE